MECLGKAEEMIKREIKEKRRHGLAISSLVTVALIFTSKGYFIMIKNQKWVWIQTVNGFFPIVFGCLVTMIQNTSYTVLYFQCKKIRGEEIKLERILEYSKIPSKPLVAKDIP